MITVFCWLTPYYKKRISLSDSIAAGSVWFLFHSSWVVTLLVSYGHDVLASIFMVTGLLYTNSIFYLWHQLLSYRDGQGCIGLIAWYGSTILFLYFLTYGYFCCLGLAQGYIFADPMISLMYHPTLACRCIKYGQVAGWTIMLLGNLLVAKLWHYSRCLCMLVVLLWVGLWHMSYTVHDDQYADSVACACMTYDSEQTPFTASLTISDEIVRLYKKNKNIQAYVFPESSFCYDIATHQQCIDSWTDILGDAPLIMGTYHRCNQGLCNSVVVIQHGAIVQRYCKQHAMMCVESNLGLLRYFGQQNLFGTICSDCDGMHTHDVVTINGVSYQMFICSELFFQTKQTKGLPIMMLWNRYWFMLEWTKTIADLTVKYLCCIKNVDYCSCSIS